jgi:hypothetical protein
MAVMPRAHLFFACADVAIDAGNSITMRDPLYAVYLNQSTGADTFASGVLCFYARLIEGLGEFHCRVEAFDDNGVFVKRSTPTTITFTEDNRFEGIQFPLMLPSMAVRPGVYEFALLANYVETPLATCEIRFIEGV